MTQVTEWQDGQVRRAQDCLVAEEPLEIRSMEPPLSVTMRTPGHDLELTAGFSCHRRSIERREQIVSLDYGKTELRQPDGTARRRARKRVAISVDVQLTETSLELEPEQTRRNFFMTSSCGICGKASIEAVKAHGIRRPKEVWS